MDFNPEANPIDPAVDSTSTPVYAVPNGQIILSQHFVFPDGRHIVLNTSHHRLFDDPQTKEYHHHIRRFGYPQEVVFFSRDINLFWTQMNGLMEHSYCLRKKKPYLMFLS